VRVSRSSAPISSRRAASIRSIGPVTLTATERPAGRTSATPTHAIPASFSSISVDQPRAAVCATTSSSRAGEITVPSPAEPVASA
jgi:hypothetical protein